MEVLDETKVVWEPETVETTVVKTTESLVEASVLDDVV